MRLISLSLSLLFLWQTAGAQLKFSRKVEAGYLMHDYTLVQVDPGPEWKGYYLGNEENGADFNVIYGLKLKEKTFAGLGAGYINFEGIHGISVFANADHLLLKTRLSPVLSLKVGYSHIWNQYAGGTGTALLEPGAGFNYRLNANLQLYLISGFTIMQQTLFIPLRAGVSF